MEKVTLQRNYRTFFTHALTLYYCILYMRLMLLCYCIYILNDGYIMRYTSDTLFTHLTLLYGIDRYYDSKMYTTNMAPEPNLFCTCF